jgi:hypothetical protein
LAALQQLLAQTPQQQWVSWRRLAAVTSQQQQQQQQWVMMMQQWCWIPVRHWVCCLVACCHWLVA